VPNANGQRSEISAPTVRRNPQDRVFIQQETDTEAQITGQKQQGSIPATDRKMIQIEIDAPGDSAQTWMKDLADLLAAAPQNDINDIFVKDIKDTGLNERTGDFNQIKLDTTKPENESYVKDFPPLQGSPTTSTPLSAQSPPTIIEDKYAPSLSYQINFHLPLLTWCKAAMDNHHYMAQQHHHTSPGHTWQLHLSLLAHHATNHHVYQLELARQAFILETNTRIGLQAIENNDNKPSGDSNCTPLSEDSACPSVTITSMELKHRPTHKEQTKETTTTNEREIILKTETRPGPKTTKNIDC
jgi:hypothetical protein